MNPKWIVALVVSGVAPIGIGAQAERVTLRSAPKPNQVRRSLG